MKLETWEGDLCEALESITLEAAIFSLRLVKDNEHVR
jgi:hypothetical protein